MSSYFEAGPACGKVISAFEEAFVRYGFEQHEPEPLVPREDRSVLFTNATVTGLKKLLLEGAIPRPGVWLVQRCLRLQNLRGLGAPEFAPEYMSHFRMVGALAAPCDQRLSTSIQEFLYKAAPDGFELAAASSEQDLLRYFGGLAHDGQLQQLSSAMVWSYGLKGIVGRGVDIRLRQSDGPAQSVGQLVEIRCSTGVLAYEFGFGVETFAARAASRRSPFAAAELTAHLSFKDEACWLQLMDAISILTTLYANSVVAAQSRRGSIARKVMRLLPMLAARCRVQLDKVLQVCVAYCSELSSPREAVILAGAIRDSWENRRAALERVQEYLDNQVRLVRYGHKTPVQARNDLNRYSSDTGRLLEEEAADFGARLEQALADHVT